jgi:anti-sigma B factor antagonist
MIRLEDRGEVVVVYFTPTSILEQGMIDQIGRELAGATLEAAGNKKLLLNFQDIKFMASMMIGKILQVHKQCKNDKIKLKLCSISSNIMEVFKITNLTKLFEIYPDEASAVAAFGKRGFFS